MPLYTAHAIVLRRISFGETDRIVTLLTRERGKISAIAKGSRKPISRLAGPTELMTYSRMQLATGRNLDIVTQVDVKESFPRIRSDLQKIAHATYLMELVDRLTEEHERSVDLFDTLLSALYLMERPNDPEKIAHMFELHFMKLLGYEPVLDKCLRCGSGRATGFTLTPDPSPSEGRGECASPLPSEGEGSGVRVNPVAPTASQGVEEMHFSPSLGGLACGECGPLPEDSIPVTREAVETMRRLLTAEPPEVEKMEIARDTMDQISRVMRWFIRFHSDREIKSADFLQAIRGEK